MPLSCLDRGGRGVGWWRKFWLFVCVWLKCSLMQIKGSYLLPHPPFPLGLGRFLLRDWGSWDENLLLWYWIMTCPYQKSPLWLGYHITLSLHKPHINFGNQIRPCFMFLCSVEIIVSGSRPWASGPLKQWNDVTRHIFFIWSWVHGLFSKKPCVHLAFPFCFI